MLGHKAREFKQHRAISLEDLVPKDNFCDGVMVAAGQDLKRLIKQKLSTLFFFSQSSLFEIGL